MILAPVKEDKYVVDIDVMKQNTHGFSRGDVLITPELFYLEESKFASF